MVQQCTPSLFISARACYELFVGSEEVRKELPEAAGRFTRLDVGVRATLAAAWGDKFVAAACVRQGLADRLRDIGKDLELCKKALADFLAKGPTWLNDFIPHASSSSALPTCARPTCAICTRASPT